MKTPQAEKVAAAVRTLVEAQWWYLHERCESTDGAHWRTEKDLKDAQAALVAALTDETV